MKVILLQNLPGTGKKGDVKDVADGHARNFLLPKKLAVLATSEGLAALERQKSQVQRQTETELKQAQKLSGQLAGKTVEVKAKASEGGKLYAAVTAAQIAEALAQKGYVVKPEHIKAEHLKEVGEHQVQVDLGQGMKGSIKVVVKAEA